MSSLDAKTYLSRRGVPALFECLMTGLMFHRPTDHIQYLIDCLEKVKTKGQEELRWNMFIEMQRSKTPLPPITPSNGRRPMSRERSMTPKVGPGYFWIENYTIEEERGGENRTATPLPPIGSAIPDVPVIFLMGGPGCGKSTQAEMLVAKYPGWVTVAVGELLRKEIADRGAADEKWKMVGQLMNKGEMAPEDVVATLLMTKMRACHNADGFIIQGFPRDMEQATQYDKMVGRCDGVFLLDCEEETLAKQLLERAQDDKRIDNNVNTVAKRIQSYRENTLPVLKHYDDMEKLFILEGEKDKEDIAEDLAVVFETVIGGGKPILSPVPPKDPMPERKRSATSRGSPKKARSPEPEAEVASSPAPEADMLPAHLMPPEIKVKDEGRKEDMPQAPIIFVAGGPGSGKGTQCKKLCARYTNAVHLSMGDILRSQVATQGSADMKWGMISELLREGQMAPEDVTIDLLTSSLKAKPDAHFFLVEGFPRNLEQLEDFNKTVGGATFTVLLDCEEPLLHFRLMKRGKDSGRIDDNLTAVGKKLTYFTENTLPILKTMEDAGKLVAIGGDRDEDEIFFDMCKILDFAIYNQMPEMPSVTGADDDKEDGKAPVVEETMVAATAVTTGNDDGNPAHTAALDATDKPAEPAADTVKPEETPAEEPKAEAKEETPQEIAKEEAAPATEEAKEESKPAEEPAKTEEAAAVADDAAKPETTTEEAAVADDTAKPETATEAAPAQSESKPEEAQEEKKEEAAASEEAPAAAPPAAAAAEEETPAAPADAPATEGASEEAAAKPAEESPKAEEETAAATEAAPTEQAAADPEATSQDAAPAQ